MRALSALNGGEMDTPPGAGLRRPPGAAARISGVNRPELLPPADAPVTEVIDVAGFLTPGEEGRMRETIRRLEKDTGVKVRYIVARA